MNPPIPGGESRRSLPLPPPHPSSSSSSSSSVPLLNLAIINSRIDSIHNFLSDSISSNTILTKPQMDTLSNEITSAIHQVIINGATLLAYSTQDPTTPSCPQLENFGKDHTFVLTKIGEEQEREQDDDFDIIELDAIELLAENIHFCDICGKGFKRDANLRMHMRAHGDQFKTIEALSKPSSSNGGFDDNKGESIRNTRFSCPFEGCNRNRKHRKFRALKSVICVKNHFKRSHCPKMYACNRCNKKSFSVLADLKSHLKHCGEAKWMCSCGTSFSRKDKLFGHVALFEGHMPALSNSSCDNSCINDVDADDDERLVDVNDEEGDVVVKGEGVGANIPSDNELFEWLLDGFGSMDNCDLQAVLNGIGSGMDGFSRC